MKNKNTLISIIIPVYNTKKEYLEKCLESVLNQTYKNIEILVIDDGSNIETKHFLSLYESKDRLKIIFKDNSGVSDSRNIGLENAKGEWILFVDSDDLLSLDCCETFMAIENINELDMILAKTWIYMEEIQEKKENYGGAKEGLVQNKQELIDAIFLEKGTRYSYIDTSWAKLFRKKFLNTHQLRFKKELKLGEDGLFMYECIKESTFIYFLNKPMYVYRRNPFSVCSSFHSDYIKNFETLFQMYDHIFQMYHVQEKSFHYFVIRQISNIIQKYFMNPNNHDSYKTKKKSFIQMLNIPLFRAALDQIETKQLSKGKKIIVMFCKYHFFRGIIVLYKIKNLIRKCM